MKVCFDIIEDSNSKIFIEDKSIFGTSLKDTFTSENTIALNILQEITLDKVNTLGIFLDEITVPRDGWFKIIHIILPTESWLETNPIQYDNIYLYTNNGIYKYVNENLIKVSLSELLEINPNSKTTLNYAEEDFFNTDNLEQCIVNLANYKVIDCGNSKEDPCGPGNCKRDYLWHALNIIKYYLKCGNPKEALKLLNTLNTCIDFCSNNSSGGCCLPKKCSCNE